MKNINNKIVESIKINGSGLKNSIRNDLHYNVYRNMHIYHHIYWPRRQFDDIVEILNFTKTP